MIKLVIILYILSLLVSLCIGVFRFWIDVAKWHDREKKVKITPSSFDYDIKKGGADNDRRRNDDGRDNGADNRTGDSDRDGDGDNNGDNNNIIHFGA